MESRILTLAQLNAEHYGSSLGPEMWLYEGPMTGSATDFCPLRFDSLMLMAVHSGSATIGVDETRYRLEPNTIGILRPYSYMTSFTLHSDEPLQVTTIGCTERVENSIAPTLDDLLPLVIKAHMDPVVRMQPGGVEALRPYVGLLRAMTANELPGAHTSRKAGCIFKAALYEIIERRLPDDTSALSGRNREITAHFLYLLGKHFHRHRDVEYYSALLGISPKHLSAVLKRAFGRTASDYIEMYVVREAKIMLTSTSLRIKEIATRLSFSSQAFFGKYFRHATGVSPSEYRRDSQCRADHDRL